VQWMMRVSSLGISGIVTCKGVLASEARRLLRRPVAERAIVADAPAVAIEEDVPIPADLALSLAYLAAAFGALGHLGAIRARLDQPSVYFRRKHPFLLSLSQSAYPVWVASLILYNTHV